MARIQNSNMFGHFDDRYLDPGGKVVELWRISRFRSENLFMFRKEEHLYFQTTISSGSGWQ